MLESLLDPGTLLVFVVGFLLCKWLMGAKVNLPPGPASYPIIGSLPTLMKAPIEKGHLLMQGLAEQYGGLFSLKVGSNQWVVVSDADIAREVFVVHGSNFSGRPTHTRLMQGAKKMFGDFGIIWSSGDHSKYLRKFTLTALRDFGMGKKSLEDKILDEVSAVGTEIQRQAQKPFDVEGILQRASSNIICSICFGDRYEYSEKEFKDILETLNKISKNVQFADIRGLFDWLWWLPLPEKAKKIFKSIHEMNAFIDMQIMRHREVLNKENVKDFVDLYLTEDRPKESTVTDDNMKRTVNDLFFAGTDTTSTTLAWAFLFMITHPQVQKRCQEEIEEVVGNSRAPRLEDRQNMPYVEATLHEIMRLGAVAPVTVPHMAKETMDIRGYTIPKHTTVFLNIYNIHRDPNKWEEPDSFKPERWLDNGKFVKRDNFLPFGIGPRTCIGEQFARSELFLFFTGLLQKFDYINGSEEKELSLEGDLGITLRPQPFSVIAKERWT